MSLLPQEIIRRKRDGGALDAEHIEHFIEGLTAGRVTEGQAASFAMAIFFRGLTVPERVALTRAMMNSGTVLTWDLPGPVLDKHSTGGVGDTVSLALGPAVAACGGYVPMISGRGLGHTGGTLDKFDSIPGYVTQPDLDTFRRVTREVGCAIIGQTADLAPADKRLYAIRDVTATVESIDLITASILSKKLSAGLQGLVMDVKFGSGAFMDNAEDARKLAESLVLVANGAGLPTSALLTDMNEPLASAAGNAVEMAYAVEYLTGRRREKRFHEVTVELSAEMLLLGKLAADIEEARAKIEQAISSGKAAEVFQRMVSALGGPADVLEQSREASCRRHPSSARSCGALRHRAEGSPRAMSALPSSRSAAAVRVRRIRSTMPSASPSLQPSARRSMPRRPLAIVHARSEAAAEAAARAVRAAYHVGNAQAGSGPSILERIGATA